MRKKKLGELSETEVSKIDVKYTDSSYSIFKFTAVDDIALYGFEVYDSAGSLVKFAKYSDFVVYAEDGSSCVVYVNNSNLCPQSVLKAGGVQTFQRTHDGISGFATAKNLCYNISDNVFKVLSNELLFFRFCPNCHFTCQKTSIKIGLCGLSEF